MIDEYYRKEKQKELQKEESKKDIKIERVEENEDDEEKKSLDSFKYFGLEEEKTEPNTNKNEENLKIHDQDKINSLKEFHIFNYEKIESNENKNWYNVGFSFSDCSFDYNTINKNFWKKKKENIFINRNKINDYYKYISFFIIIYK